MSHTLLVGSPNAFRLSFPGLVNDSTFLLVDCSLGVASRNCAALSPAELSLEREATLHVSSQSAPPSARVFNVDGCSCVSYQAFCDILGRAVFVTGDDVYPGTWVFTLVATLHESALHRSETMK